MLSSDQFKKLIRTIPDHPNPGVQYRDITTLLMDPEGLRSAIDGLVERHADTSVDVVVGIEARGFLFGPTVAYRLGVGFVPLRKPGKLPGKRIGRAFTLEYGEDRIELHEDTLEPGHQVLLVDDLLATGGTAEAAVGLIRETGAEVASCAFLVALPDLGGIQRLRQAGCRVEWLCEFQGD